MEKKKQIPEVHSNLRNRSVKVPEAIYQCSGIKVLGSRIKSLLFSTDVAVIRNSNAQAVMAVYPFTPQLSIAHAILEVSSTPVFVGVGGGLTHGERILHIALQSELMGAHGVVVNAPIPHEDILAMRKLLDIPIIATVVSKYDEIEKKVESGAQILNISGGKNTAELVSVVRQRVGAEFPIIATGGHSEAHITETIQAGANAITYTPPSSSDIFKTVMEDYRIKKSEE